MTSDPFADAKRRDQQRQGEFALALGRVVNVPSGAAHQVLLKPITTTTQATETTPEPATVGVDVKGDIALPSVGDMVVYSNLGNRKPVVLTTLYSSESLISDYNAEERVVGHQATDSTITLDADGDIVLDAERDVVGVSSSSSFSGDHDDLTNVQSGQHHSKTTSASELTDVSSDKVVQAQMRRNF